MDLELNIVSDPSLQEFKDEIDKLSIFNFRKYASIQLVYMSHGDANNIVYCKDGEFDFIEESIRLFNNPTLKGKPKYIIIEACKGKYDINWIYESTMVSKYEGSIITALLTSSFEGCVSYMHEDGSQFIKNVCKVVKENWFKTNYSDVLSQVLRTNVYSDQQSAVLHRLCITDAFSYESFIKKPNDGDFVI